MSAFKVEDSEVFRTFACWTGVLLLKTLLMACLTAQQRIRKKILISPEDRFFLKHGKVSFVDEDVERVRRAHQNDLENILPWIFCTCFWLTTGPAPWLATLLIRTFSASRILHTIVYAIFPLPQPARVLAFGVAYCITAFQLASTVLYYL